MKIYTLDDLLTSIIEGIHGWSVRGQFESTWNGESVEEQNPNAMESIIDTLQGIVDGELLSESAQRDVITYLDRIKEEMNLEGDDDIEDKEFKNDDDDNQNLQEQILKDFKRFL